VEIVEEFWAAVWKGRNPEAIDRFVADDFVLTTGGIDIVSRAAFKEWVRQFLAKITDFEFEVVETFQNEDGSRVASRWRVSGKNNGVLGTRADQRPIAFTGTAVWAVREDGKLHRRFSERQIAPVIEKLQTRIDELEAEVERLQANPQPNVHPNPK
jgi:SnoaL-like domain